MLKDKEKFDGIDWHSFDWESEEKRISRANARAIKRMVKRKLARAEHAAQNRVGNPKPNTTSNWVSVDMEEKKQLQNSHRKDVFLCFGVFIAATVISFFFNKMASDPSLNIAMLYTLGVFIITRYTDGYIYGILFSIMSVLSVNFFFTYPYQDFNFSIDGYQVTFFGMFVIGVITSAMSTRMKEAQRQIAKQEKELMEAQKEKMRANLLRAVSHDIRTPLTGIIGSSSSYLEMGDELTEEDKRDLIQHINDDANWLLNMVENLLSVTRISSDADSTGATVTKSLEPVDEVASAAVIQFKKRFPEASVRVRVPDDFIMVMMDAMLIQQVIINILQNAWLHSGTTKPIELTIDDDENWVYFHIRDYGVGLDPNRLDEIFDGGGYKARDVKADGYKGMGIGLSICKTIVIAHGGQIRAINHDEGAEFRFWLPKEKEDENASEDFSADY